METLESFISESKKRTLTFKNNMDVLAHFGVDVYDIIREEHRWEYRTKTTCFIFRKIFTASGVFEFVEIAKMGKERKDGTRSAGKSIRFEVLK